MGKDRKGHKQNKCTSENKESKSWVKASQDCNSHPTSQAGKLQQWFKVI
jgi:hypothetical protein